MASYRLKAALAASIALHALLIVKAAPEAKVQIRHPAPALRASITAGPVSAESAARGTAGRAQRQIKRAPSSAPGKISGTATATPEHATTVDTQRNAPREPEVLEIAALDPRDYFRPLQVDEVAVPLDPAILELLPLTGEQAGAWVLRLFIDDSGRLREIEVIEADASERNTRELLAILRNSPFAPARKGDASVKSQKMVEVSFDPAKGPGMSTPVPIPSATEK